MTDVYAAAGVNIDAGNDTVERIAPLAAATHQTLAQRGATLLSGVGGFAAAVALPENIKQPTLVAATDGVGTKLELAREYGCLETIGQDLVAMCVNDLLCAGAQPWVFLDYYACGELTPDHAAAVVSGISKACIEADCALVGGETAEMPGTYNKNKFDIAGFAVGVAEKSDLLFSSAVQASDSLIAIASNGAHSNGYSLIRHIFGCAPRLRHTKIGGEYLTAALLRPTRLYCRSIAKLREAVELRGLAHITGGGMTENLPRILPPGTRAEINEPPLPPLFAALQQAASVPEANMRRVFNCGVGMVAVVAPQATQDAIAVLRECGEEAWQIGRVVPTP